MFSLKREREAESKRLLIIIKQVAGVEIIRSSVALGSSLSCLWLSVRHCLIDYIFI